MTNRFLISAAVAALITGTGFANAQGTGSSREATVGWFRGAAERAIAERGGAASGTMHRDSGASGMKGANPTEGFGFPWHEGIGIQREDAVQQERAGHQDAAR